MSKLGLKIEQRLACNVTSKKIFSDAVAGNLVKINFNCSALNRVQDEDVTYLKKSRLNVFDHCYVLAFVQIAS